MKTAYIGIGSNMGDPRSNCLNAVERIGRVNGCRITGLSGLYMTEPVGVEGQDWYVNGVASVDVDMPARSLLECLLAIETEMGRVKNGHWSSRIIDLDILLFSREIIHEKCLIVPHPLMHQRRFVLAPMADMAPDLIHPSIGKSMIELLQKIPENDQAIKLILDH